MRTSILAAASVIALGIGGVGVGHAALETVPDPGQSLWRQEGPAPEFLLAKYQQFNRQQHAQSGATSGRNSKGVAQQQWAKYRQFNQQWHDWACC